MSVSVDRFIEENIDSFTRECKEESGTLIPLPHPFSIPSKDHFEEMYYWDTYFTNIGLIASGRINQAKNNTDNILYLVRKYGFMPNASRTTFLTRSQPPFLALMVKDIFKVTGDLSWLQEAYETLKKELEFWREKRKTETGLNRYYGFAKEEEADYLAARFTERTTLTPDMKSIDIARHMRLCFESGWDINPRWGCHGYDFVHVDLNSMLYSVEMCMSEFASILKNGEEEIWKKAAERRRELMRQYMKTGDGYFTDYDYVNNKFSDVFSAASFYPLFVSLADDEEAAKTVRMLSRLEENFGISACEKNGKEGNFQWNYPNGWAPHQYLVFRALKNYGYEKEAKRVAEKYITLVEKVFSETNNLWEKYNVVDGNIEVNTESPMPPMMGWSAGVYLALKDELAKYCTE